MKKLFMNLLLGSAVALSGAAFANTAAPQAKKPTEKVASKPAQQNAAAQKASAQKAAPATKAASSRVNINTADAIAISNSLDGIGPKKAQAIVDYRKKNGAFTSLAQLEQVSGIGPVTIERNRQLIVFR